MPQNLIETASSALVRGKASMDFKLVSDYTPQGDQGRAIEQLVRGVRDGEKHQVLLGVTGSGKTFTMGKVIEHTQRPALVLAHNKTLAAQLYHEFKQFFPHNNMAYRTERFGDEVESLSQIDPLFGTVKQKYQRLPIYPKTHYVMKPETKTSAVASILEELGWWELELQKQGRLVESQRIHQRTRFDLEMIKSMGYCHGIENYSRHFTKRLPGEPPPTLLDYVPRDFMLFIDESHQTVPRPPAMWHGGR